MADSGTPIKLQTDEEYYEQVPTESIAASKLLVDMYERLGKPKTPFTKSGEKVMNMIFKIWQDLYPLDAQTWHETRKEYKITKPVIIQCANELNDVPNPAGSYRTAGWLKDDEALLIYDRYDIWKVDPENKYAPINLTIEGRNTNTTYRLLQLDKASQGRFGSGVADLRHLRM